MEKYLVIIEKADNNYSAFSPDIWGCIGTGKTVEETLLQMKEALIQYVEAIVSEGEDMPKARGISQHISDGVFNEGEIADQYFITEVEIPIPQHV